MKRIISLIIGVGLMVSTLCLEARGGARSHRSGHSHRGHHEGHRGRHYRGHYGHGAWAYGGWRIGWVPGWASTLGWTLVAGSLLYNNQPVSYYQQNQPIYYQKTIVPQLDRMHAEQENQDIAPVNIE